MEEFIEKIKRLESQIIPENKVQTFEGIVDLIVECLAKYSKVNADEVGIILLTSNKNFLRFVAPKKLYKGGATFPISKRESISTKVITTLKAEIQNNLSSIKHLSIYEQVKTSETGPKIIQKMLTLPLILEGKATGVIQISRKGDTPEQSGPDFTQNDIQKILELSSSFLPSLIKSKPEFI